MHLNFCTSRSLVYREWKFGNIFLKAANERGTTLGVGLRGWLDGGMGVGGCLTRMHCTAANFTSSVSGDLLAVPFECTLPAAISRMDSGESFRHVDGMCLIHWIANKSAVFTTHSGANTSFHLRPSTKIPIERKLRPSAQLDWVLC